MLDRHQALAAVQELMSRLFKDNLDAISDPQTDASRDPAVCSRLIKVVGAIGFTLVQRLFDDDPSSGYRSLARRQPELVSSLDATVVQHLTAVFYAAAVKFAGISRIVPEKLLVLARTCFLDPVEFSAMVETASNGLDQTDDQHAEKSGDARLKAAYLQTSEMLSSLLLRPGLRARRSQSDLQSVADDLTDFYRRMTTESARLFLELVTEPQAAPAPAAAAARAYSASPTSPEQANGSLLGCLFWLCVLAGLGYWWFR